MENLTIELLTGVAQKNEALNLSDWIENTIGNTSTLKPPKKHFDHQILAKLTSREQSTALNGQKMKR